MNERHVGVGRPHPNHSFTKPYPTFYETAQGAREKQLMDEILVDEKSMFARLPNKLVVPCIFRILTSLKFSQASGQVPYVIS